MEELYTSGNALVEWILLNKILQQIVKMIPDNRGFDILDAGCGEGQFD